MRRIHLLVLMLSAAFFSPPSNIRAADAWRKLYEGNTYKHGNGQKLPYRLLKPEKIEPGKTYPLVLFLHGGGERGNDNDLHLYIGGKDFSEPEFQKKHPCFVLFPQCPSDSSWTTSGSTSSNEATAGKPLDPLELSMALVGDLTAQLPIDKDRIYATGVCMGGVGVWTALERRPDFFAAAIPICSRGEPTQAAKLKNIPLWAFHGDKDPVVPVEDTQRMIAAIIKAGGKPKMTIYPGVNHNSWSATYSNPEVMAWLFAQKKSR